jgi:signal transduction histidine kinase
VLHDITDTEHLDQLRDGFFAAAAHTLKTPIAIIKANVQLAARAPTRDLTPVMDAVRRQCDRIERLVQNLQVIARARTHTLRIYAGPLELAPLVLAVARDLHGRTPVEVTTEIDATPEVYGDAERLTTVVRNLTQTALEVATPHTPLTVYLAHRPHAAELGVRFRPLPVTSRTFAPGDDYSDAELAQYATATIVEAHGGEVGGEADDTQTVMWVRLPTLEKHDGRADGHPDRR